MTTPEDQARADEPVQDWEYGRQYVHHIFAGHDKRSTCSDCRLVCCEHCETWTRVGEDHTCTCPHRDGECDHPPVVRIEAKR